MKIIEPSTEILEMPSKKKILDRLERAARTCYKSEDKIKSGSAEKLLRSCIQKGHHSIFEHISVPVRIICDRGVSHELVRHRLCSFSQESTRYCNYKNKEMTFIRPFFFKKDTPLYNIWIVAMYQAEYDYKEMISHGATPQQARSILPNSLKTEMVMTANLRQWRYILDLRCSKAAHPQMRQIMLPLLVKFYNGFDLYYEDIYKKYEKDITEGFFKCQK